MRILFYINRYPAFGGIENITSVLARAFTEKLNYSVGIFSYERLQDLKSQTPENVHCFYADNFDETGQKLFIDTVKTFNPDVVIFQDSYAPIEGPLLKLKQKYKFKLIIVEHNTPNCFILGYKQRWKAHSWLDPKGAAKKLLYPIIYSKIKKRVGARHRILIEAADQYVLLSDSYKSVLKKYWQINDNRLIAIPNIKNDFGLKPLIDFSHKEKIVLFVGRLTEQKGIKYLLDIWSKIEKQNSSWKLIVLGDGELNQYVKEEISKRELLHIELLGFKSNVSDYYRRASAIFMSSIYEGFPLILAEAMQFGTIPFAFESFTAVNDIIDEDCGFKIKPFDVDAFVEKFLQFTEYDANRMEKLRKNAVKKSNMFAEEPILGTWKKIIEN